MIAEEGRLNKDIRAKKTQKKGISFNDNNVLYGKLRPYLHNWFKPDFAGVAVGDWWVLRPVGIDRDFLYRLIQTKRFDCVANQSSGSKMPRADWKLVSNTKFIIPISLDEQHKIAEIFEQLDNLIFLHKLRINTLKKYKRGLLNALMTEKIKFNKCSKWEEKKLSEVLEIDSCRNAERIFTKDDVLSVSDEYGVLNQIEFHGRSFAGEDISGYKIVKTGQIIYTKSPLASKPYGIIKIVGEETGVVSPLYIVNNAKKDIDPLFIYYYFDTPARTNNYLKPLVRMGAKHTMNVSNEEWLSGKIKKPDYNEQKRISKVLSQIEQIISVEQNFLDTIKTLKKGLLQKMFL